MNNVESFARSLSLFRNGRKYKNWLCHQTSEKTDTNERSFVLKWKNGNEYDMK